MHANQNIAVAARRILALGGLAAALIVPSHASAANCPGANADPNTASLQATRAATLCLLNAERRAHGVRKLRENHRLDVASQRHSGDMVRRRYFAHGDFVGRIRAAHYLSGVGSWMLGENIAWGDGSYATPAAIVDLWMHSPPHRENILNRSFHEIGIGIAAGAPTAGVSDAGTYSTDFGTRG